MALLTAEERAKLAEEGLWVREKCDGPCGKPILSPVSFIKKVKGKEQTWCAGCAKGQDLVLAETKVTTKEENEMAKAKAEKKAAPKKETSKIAGHLVEGTAIADLYQFLEDEKKHSLKDAKKVLAKHKADPMGRIYQLGRYGKKFGLWGVIVDEDTIQLKKGKEAAAASKKKAPKEKEEPKKKATSKKEQEPEEKGAMPSKALKATMALVRRTLKTGKDWTKNKLMEHLIKEHDQDPKRIAAAVQEEIKAGGIEVDDGILTLV